MKGRSELALHICWGLRCCGCPTRSIHVVIGGERRRQGPVRNASGDQRSKTKERDSGRVFEASGPCGISMQTTRRPYNPLSASPKSGRQGESGVCEIEV